MSKTDIHIAHKTAEREKHCSTAPGYEKVLLG